MSGHPLPPPLALAWPRPAGWLIGLVILIGLIGLVALAPLAALGALGLAVGAVSLAWLLWRQPALGVLVIAFVTSALLPRSLTILSMPGLRADLADLTLLGALGLLVLRGWQQRRLVLPAWSISGPLLALAGCALFSALWARLYHGVDPVLIMGELRPALYCAGVAVIVATLPDRRHLLRLLVGLFLLADLTAAAIFVQQFIYAPGSPVPTPPSGIWQIHLVDEIASGFGAVRVVPPGHVLLYLMANVAACLALLPRLRPWLRLGLLLQVALLGLALLLTYTRAQWIASAIALLVIVLLLPRPALHQLGRGLPLAIPVGLLAIGLLGSGLLSVGTTDVGTALAERAGSIFTPGETLDTASLEWRGFEVAAVSAALGEHPLLGVGLGNDYRDVTLLQGEASGWLWELGGGTRLTRFVHNSYLYLAVKMGLPALALFAWLSLALLVGGGRIARHLGEGPLQLLVLAMVGSFVGLLEWSFFIAHLMLPASMTTLGLMIGLVAYAARALPPTVSGGVSA